MENQNSFSLIAGLGKNLSYYPKIERSGDLLKSAMLTHFGKTNLLVSDYYIAPSKVPLDPLALEALNELSDKLSILKTLPEKNHLLSEDSIQTVLKIQNTANANAQPNSLLEELQQAGHTGVIIKTAKKLDASILSPADREILSRPPLAMYAYYRAVFGMGVTDFEGVVSNAMTSLKEIKKYINEVLVDKVISKEDLEDTNSTKRNHIKSVLKNASLTYAPGEVTKLVRNEYDKVKIAGDLNTTIESFLDTSLFNSGISLPPGINRRDLIDKMIQYLVKLGYKPSSDTVGGIGQVSIEDNLQEQLNQKIQNVVDLESKVVMLNTQIEYLTSQNTESRTIIEQSGLDSLELIPGLNKEAIQALNKENIKNSKGLARLNKTQMEKILGGKGLPTDDIIKDVKLLTQNKLGEYIKTLVDRLSAQDEETIK